MHLLVVNFSILRCRAGRHTRSTNHHYAVLRSLFKDRPDSLVDVAVADARRDDARLHECFSLIALDAGVVVDDADFGQLIELRHVKRRFELSAQTDGFIGDLVVEDPAHFAEVHGLERFRLRGI